MSEGRAIYVDLDDVLGETARMFLELLAEDWGREVRFETITDFDLSVSFALSQEELGRFMDLAHCPDRLQSIAPIAGAVEAVGSWREAGYDVRVVTGRPLSSAEASRRWLERHGLPHETLAFVDKYSRLLPWSAAQASVEVLDLDDLAAAGFEFAVEDSLHFAEVLAGELELPVALLDRPWNRRIEEVDPAAADRIVRCRDWEEIVARFPSAARPES